jgi:hypothetical protein
MKANAFAPDSAAAVQNHTLTQPELDRARLYLEQTKIGILGSTRNLSAAQWSFKPGHDRWSIAEIVEHVIFVQDRVLGPIWETLENSREVALHPDHKQVDDIIVYQFPNRLSKFPAPAQPAGGLACSEALDRLLENYSRLNDYLEKPGLRLRSLEAPPLRAISSGAFERMDGYQWILATSAHTERHTKQILEVMAEPHYPI